DPALSNAAAELHVQGEMRPKMRAPHVSARIWLFFRTVRGSNPASLFITDVTGWAPNPQAPYRSVPEVMKSAVGPACGSRSGQSWSWAFLSAFICLKSASVVLGAGSADLSQARNGTADIPRDPVTWGNGNAGPANSH